ncbi:MAG: hypothetical protein LBC86_06550 [Oscillospiraceae bacterium]|jgi:hypothetical protein|nr:hypothetical protein [Oscillospiraceae bacterium]
MQTKYEGYSAQEIREMFFDNTLEADLMSINEYEKLFGCEMNLDEPNADVLVFCTKGLNQHEKYSRDIQKPSFEVIAKKLEQKKRQIRKNSAFKAIHRVAAALVITTALAFFAQIVAMALGFDLFGYIYNWLFKESVEITTSESKDDGSFDLPPITDDGEDEVVFLEFERIEEIDEVWLNCVSPYLIDNYEFDTAYYLKVFDDRKFEIHFIDENENLLTLIIQNQPMFYIEKEDEGYVKELSANSITFSIFNNMEDFHVIWERDGFLCSLGAFLPLEAVEEIIQNYYSAN